MSDKDAIKKASLIQIRDERLQCAICIYLAVGPLQFKCGHRICTSCARRLKQQRYVAIAIVAIVGMQTCILLIDCLSLYSSTTFFCNQCKETVNFIDVSYVMSVVALESCHIT